MGGPPSTPRTPARKGRKAKGARDLNTNHMAESYFEAQSAKVSYVYLFIFIYISLLFSKKILQNVNAA